jgi:hypothetical protein
MPNDVIAERALDYGDGETTRPVTIRIYRPEERDGRWECVAELVGIPGDRLNAYGADSVQALMHALDAVGTEVRKHKLSVSAGHPWPVRLEPIELMEKPKPAPLPPEVIAEREVERLADDEAEGGEGKIILYKPVPAGENEWICEYELAIPGHTERKTKALGVDSAQALIGALHVLAASLSHEPVIGDDGYHAWEPYRSPNYDYEPMPLLIKRLRAYGTETPWLVDLNTGIATLRQIGRWIEAGKEIDRGGIEALDRSLRYLQAAKGTVEFPDVQDADIGRISEIRRILEACADAQPPAELQARIDEALRSWTRMAHVISDSD